jgi:hypothetical protein
MTNAGERRRTMSVSVIATTREIRQNEIKERSPTQSRVSAHKRHHRNDQRRKEKEGYRMKTRYQCPACGIHTENRLGCPNLECGAFLMLPLEGEKEEYYFEPL